MTGVVLAAVVAIETAITNGAAFLVKCQAEDGHWSDPQMPALTALPLWALSGACGGVKAARSIVSEQALRKAAGYVLATQRPDGGFYVPKPGRGGSGLGNYNTSVCLSALFDSGLAPAAALLNDSAGERRVQHRQIRMVALQPFQRVQRAGKAKDLRDPRQGPAEGRSILNNQLFVVHTDDSHRAFPS